MNEKKQIEIISGEFAAGLQNVLGDKLHAAYLYGATVFNDSLPTGDIDFHVILKDKLTCIEKRYLESLHKELTKKYPPLGSELDGYYILLEDAKKETPPQSEMWNCATDNAWALHREHIRAGRYRLLHGGDPKEIYLPSTWSEIETALFDEIRYIKENLDKYPDYCILNLCRLIYSFQTRDVVISKARASEWSFVEIPKWRWLVELARKSYEGKATSQDKELMLVEIKRFFEYATSHIDQICQEHKNDSYKDQNKNSG
jgi:hypothetical protein